MPRINAAARLWLPLASTDSFQTVAVESIQAPEKHRILPEREHANQVLFLELDPRDSGKQVAIRYQVRRLNKAAYAAPAPDQEKSLGPERLVPANADFRQIAAELVRGKKGDLVVGSGPAAGPINFLAYPVLEIGRQPAKAAVELSFRRSASRP